MSQFCKLHPLDNLKREHLMYKFTTSNCYVVRRGFAKALLTKLFAYVGVVYNTSSLTILDVLLAPV